MVIASLVVLAGIDPLSTTGSRAAYAAGDVFALPIEVTWAVMGAGVIVLGAAGLADLYKSDVQ